MIDEYDLEAAEQEFNTDLQKGIEVARANNINLSKFKKEITEGLLSENNEDQWTFDYESYLCHLSNGVIYESPKDWGKDYYFGRWSLS